LKAGLHSWTKRNGLPPMPNQDISDLCHKLWTEHSMNVTCHITKSSITTFQHTFEGAIFHCEDKQASSLRIYCPCLCYQAIDNTFQDPSIFEPVAQDPATIVTSLVGLFNNNTAKHTHGQLALDDNSQQGTFWPNERRRSKVVDPSYPLLIHPFDLRSTSWPE